MISKTTSKIFRIVLSIKSFNFFLTARIYSNIWAKWKIWFFQMVCTLVEFMPSKILFASNTRQKYLPTPDLPIDLIPTHSLFVQKVEKLLCVPWSLSNMICNWISMNIKKVNILCAIFVIFLWLIKETFTVHAKVYLRRFIFINENF